MSYVTIQGQDPSQTTSSGKPQDVPIQTSNRNLHIAVSDLPAAYRALVDPEIASTVTPEISIDAASSGFVYFARCTVNPGDDVTGATRLLNGYPDVATVNPDDTLVLRSSTAITDVYLVGVINGTTYTSTAYGIGIAEADLADALAEMAHFTFDAADDVREVIVTLSPTLTSGQLCRVKVQGVSHA